MRSLFALKCVVSMDSYRAALFICSSEKRGIRRLRDPEAAKHLLYGNAEERKKQNQGVHAINTEHSNNIKNVQRRGEKQNQNQNMHTANTIHE